MKRMEPIYGIDLGTSNCLAARVQDIFGNLQVSCLQDDDSNTSFPSVVHFAAKDKVMVGEKAKELLPIRPESTVELVKLRLGTVQSLPIEIEGVVQNLSPQEVTGALLRHFHMLHNDKIKKAVLTVPANFNENQKYATLESGKLTGIEIVEYIAEPSAAIMYHLFENYKDRPVEQLFQREQNYLVFDFGGGTLDLSLIQVSLDEDGNLKPDVLKIDGDNTLGGNIIDLHFLRNIIEHLDEEYDDDLTNELMEISDYYFEERRFPKGASEEAIEFLLALKARIERAKIQLSYEEEVAIGIPSIDYNDIAVDRAFFEEEILVETGIIERIFDTLDNLLSSDRDFNRIDEVIFVGGSSQIPYIQQKFQKMYPQLKDKITISENYDNAIALGAAIIGAIKSGMEVRPFGMNRCHNKVPHDIYIEHENYKDIIVPSQTKYPFEMPMQKTFSICHALQTEINIMLKEKYYEHDFVQKRRTSKEHEIKDVKFYHPFFYTNEDLTVTITINEQGFLSINALHNRTGESIDIETKKLYQLTNEEFRQAKIRLDDLVEV